MGADRIRYLSGPNRWGGFRWNPSPEMRAAGLRPRSLGSNEQAARIEAVRLNAKWDAHPARQNSTNYQRQKFEYAQVSSSERDVLENGFDHGYG